MRKGFTAYWTVYKGARRFKLVSKWFPTRTKAIQKALAAHNSSPDSEYQDPHVKDAEGRVIWPVWRPQTGNVIEF